MPAARRRPPGGPSSVLVPLWRGLTGACARCGGRGLFTSVADLHDRCPTCGLRFEREHGYWLGAMVVSIVTVVVVFGTWLVGGMLLFWPDVPYTVLLIGGVVLNGAIPVLGYGWAKTTWVGIDLAIHPPEPEEEADAYTATEAGRRDPSGRQPGPGVEGDDEGQ